MVPRLWKLAAPFKLPPFFLQKCLPLWVYGLYQKQVVTCPANNKDTGTMSIALLLCISLQWQFANELFEGSYLNPFRNVRITKKFNVRIIAKQNCFLKKISIVHVGHASYNPLRPSVAFLSPLKTSENLKV